MEWRNEPTPNTQQMFFINIFFFCFQLNTKNNQKKADFSDRLSQQEL